MVYEKSLPPIKVEIGPVIGYGQYSADPAVIMDRTGTTSLNFHVYNCNFKTSYTANIGIYAKIPLPYTSNKLIVQYEGVVNFKKFSSDYYFYYWTGEEERRPFSIQSAILSHYLFLRYDPLLGKISPLFQIGMHVSHGLSTHYSDFEDDYLSHSVSDFPFPNRVYYGLSAGLGLSYRFSKKREIFLRFACSRDFEMFYYFGVTEMNITLGIPLFIL